MGLTIPIKSTEQPSVLQIEAAIKTQVSKDNLAIWKIIYALQLTGEQVLWPGSRMTPENSIGRLWSACKYFAAAALRFHNAAQKSRVVSPDRRSTPTAATPTKSQKSKTSLAKGPSTLKKSKLSLPSKKKSSTVGKRSGTKNWTKTEINLLLDCIDELLPVGKEMWEQLAVRCLESDESWVRSGESCKHKFEKMAFAKQPTGQGDIPLHILRSKKIKDKIAQNEVLGCLYQNDEGFCDEDSEALSCEILSSTSLLSENN